MFSVLAQPYEVNPHRLQLSRVACSRLEEMGLLPPHYELIAGEILVKASQNRPHVLTLLEIVDCLTRLFGQDYVQPQMPIEVFFQDREFNYPEPDLAVLKNPRKSYRSAAPDPTEVRLVIEVSDSTLRNDLTTKVQLYARAAIALYWVVDVVNRRVFVHSDLREGNYGSLTEYGENSFILVLDSKEKVAVSSLFPEEG